MEEKKAQGAKEGPLELHKRYVAGMKQALRGATGKTRADDLPGELGMRRLRIEAAPQLSQAFGYRGSLRFVAFHYSPRHGVPVHCDGGSDLAVPNPNDWTTFVNHPAMCAELDEYPSLYGRVGARRWSPEEFQELPDTVRGAYCERFHALVVDREKARLYVAGWRALKLFQPCVEPDEEEPHRELASGELVSAGNEEYWRAVEPALVAGTLAWLDGQMAAPGIQERLSAWHTSQGRPEEARRVLDRIAAENPERVATANFQYALAYVCEETHDYAGAVAALEKTREQVPLQNAHARLRAGGLYLEVNRYGDAARELESVRDARPDLADERWHALYARAWVGLGDAARGARACEDWLRNLQEEGDAELVETGEVRAQLAEIAALAGEWAKAAELCRQAEERELRDRDETAVRPVAVYRMGWWLTARARVANAARLFACGEEEPSRRERALGYLYLAMSRYEEAAGCFELAYGETGSAETLWFWGMSLLALKRKEEALVRFGEMRARFPGDERGWIGMGMGAAAEGARDTAWEYCRVGLAGNPKSGEGLALLAYLEWCDGRYAAAREACEKAERWGFELHYGLASEPGEGREELRFLLL